ncbi:AraC family transcriptional regulator [Candidatus Haliotispira prima]|uniref:AraC family transcriptional regulator n=1 Tax=Candidatus Haliotispira prima TaxID=3034016 RepID=A0ABY8MIJ7_9SPIO|nr:AraC family transcriptional regulator [Candidatus Haliotispira prima]
MNNRKINEKEVRPGVDPEIHLFDEQDFETGSDRERCIRTAAQLRNLAGKPDQVAARDPAFDSALDLQSDPDFDPEAWFCGLSLIGQAHYQSPCHVVAPEVFARHYELIFVEKGCQTHWLDGQSYELQSGDCFLIRPMQQHSTARKAEERGRFYWWIFDPGAGLLGLDVQRSNLLLKAVIRGFVGQGDRPGAVCRLSPKNALQMRNILAALFHSWRRHELANQVNSKGAGTQDGICKEHNLLDWEHSLLDLFFVLLREQEDDRQKKPEPNLSASAFYTGETESRDANRTCLQSVCRYISGHIYENVTLEELRGLTSYSEPHLLRLFRDEYGLPLRDYINREKIDTARELLLQGLPVAEVAAKLSFSSSQYFAVVFRRYAGTSPGSWRRQNRPGIAETGVSA